MTMLEPMTPEIQESLKVLLTEKGMTPSEASKLAKIAARGSEIVGRVDSGDVESIFGALFFLGIINGYSDRGTPMQREMISYLQAGYEFGIDIKYRNKEEKEG